jgi:hypothetical protein
MFRTIHLTCALAFGALALPAQVSSVPPIVRTTGIVAIVDAQTARLNLLNPGVTPTATAAATVCSAAVAFLNAGGTVLKQGTLNVAPGTSMGLDLRSDTDLKLIAGDRIEIRATITMPAVPPPAATTSPTVAPACRLIPTLEIFDTVSGRTLVTLGRAVTISPVPTTTP